MARISEAIGYDVEVSEPNGPTVHGYITDRWANSRQADFDRFVARVKAEAWDEGYDYATDGKWGPGENPYREED